MGLTPRYMGSSNLADVDTAHLYDAFTTQSSNSAASPESGRYPAHPFPWYTAWG
jgi:hypothetical protein